MSGVDCQNGATVYTDPDLLLMVVVMVICFFSVSLPDQGELWFEFPDGERNNLVLCHTTEELSIDLDSLVLF